MLPKGIPTSPNAVQLVVRRGGLNAIALVAMVLTALIVKCTLRYALSVVKNVKCPSSLERADQYIAVTVTGKLD
jgi:hypothetical protein